jgi:ubiquinone/menaquinone biosynthesis C-methylase UbiE
MASNHVLLENLSKRTDFWAEERLGALEPRKLEELEFHNLDRKQADEAADRKRQELDMHANRKWYSVNRSSFDYVRNWIIREANGKVFLDYACGDGSNALLAARSGAALSVGLDISDESVRNARNAAAAQGLTDRCWYVQGDCEATEFPDESFDTIICSGMLHHLDLNLAYPELKRILKPGGRILCVEALHHNPLIAAYRKRTPHMRTQWEAEHILGVEDALKARRWFSLGEMRFWHLAVLGAVAFYKTPVFGVLRAIGEGVDAVILRIPGLRRMAWQFTFELVRK